MRRRLAGRRGRGEPEGERDWPGAPEDDGELTGEPRGDPAPPEDDGTPTGEPIGEPAEFDGDPPEEGYEVEDAEHDPDSDLNPELGDAAEGMGPEPGQAEAAAEEDHGG